MVHIPIHYNILVSARSYNPLAFFFFFTRFPRKGSLIVNLELGHERTFASVKISLCVMSRLQLSQFYLLEKNIATDQQGRAGWVVYVGFGLDSIPRKSDAVILEFAVLKEMNDSSDQILPVPSIIILKNWFPGASGSPRNSGWQ